MQALMTYLRDSPRSSKYSYANLLEMCLNLYPNNPYMRRIVEEAKVQLA